jgi:N-succinyldiaminopimelate aminotransferase
MTDPRPMNAVFANLSISIFETMSRLAVETKSINLGQGIPEELEPQAVIDEAARALAAGPHQYPPMRGLPELRQAVADNARRTFGLDLDWQNEIIVTSGGTEALASTFLAVLNPGDEVLLIEPAYDSYRPLLQRAGATIVPVRMTAPDWTLPRAALEAAITPKTRAIVLNAPMNPTGRLFDLEDLQFLSDLINRHDLLAICDEVYEHLTFDGQKHIPLMSLPEARARCIRIGSAGKSFSVTGWKVGYISADARILGPIARAHQYVTFTTPPALQSAVALGLGLGDDYFEGLRTELQRRRNLMTGSLRQAGFTVLDSAGTYFLNLDISPFDPDRDDFAFAQRLVREAGVATIPLSVFYGDRQSTGLVRLCFAKAPETISAGIERLKEWRDRQG